MAAKIMIILKTGTLTEPHPPSPVQALPVPLAPAPRKPPVSSPPDKHCTSAGCLACMLRTVFQYVLTIRLT